MADLGFDRVEALAIADTEPGIEFYRTTGYATVDKGATRLGGSIDRALTMERPINR